MKILVLVARDPKNPQAAGGDAHITLLAKELARSGHTVDQWCSSHPSLPPVETDEGVRIQRIAPVRLLPFVVWGRHLAGDVRPYDLVIEDLVGGARVPFFSAVLSRGPHVGFWFQNNTPLFRATFRLPLAAFAEAAQTALLGIYRNGFAIVPSDQTKAWLVSRRYLADRIAVYPRTERIPEPAGGVLPFEGRSDDFVCIGNIRPLKRLEESIEVLARLRLTLPHANLTIIGKEDDNAYLTRLRRRASAEDVKGHVELLINAPEGEKFARLARAKALTLHSPIEGLGWTIIEGGVCGTPSVGNTGVPTDVLIDQHNGLRVPSRDISAYASALQLLMTDATAWRRMSDGAREVAQRFAEPSTNQSVRELLVVCASQTAPG